MKIKYFGCFLLCTTLCIYGDRDRFMATRMPHDTSIKPSKKPQTTIKKTRKKIKRKGLQGYSHRKTFSMMDYTELMVAKNEQKKAKNWEIVIKYLDRMITLCDNINEKAVLIIELADILFEQQKYDDATKWYTVFTQLYPGNIHIEYASYRAIVCASKKILSIDRDQSATEKTLELANTFLKRADVFKKYTPAVQKIQHECYSTLAQSDCNIASFYLKYGNYHAAEQRLKSIRTQWLDKVPEMNVLLTTIEVELAALSPQFKVPESTIKVAHLKNPVKKVDMTTRF